MYPFLSAYWAGFAKKKKKKDDMFYTNTQF